MEAEELRLGNYVWNDVQQIPVKVNLKILSEQFYRKDKKQLWEPIPLTEEWVLRLGFEKVDNHDYKFNNYVVDLYGIRPYFGESWQDYRTPIDYVHQLQNLYFALTGTELKLTS
jgi:hypothetical protein